MIKHVSDCVFKPHIRMIYSWDIQCQLFITQFVHVIIIFSEHWEYSTNWEYISLLQALYLSRNPSNYNKIEAGFFLLL